MKNREILIWVLVGLVVVIATAICFCWSADQLNCCSPVRPELIVKMAFENLEKDPNSKNLQQKYITAFPADSETFKTLFQEPTAPISTASYDYINKFYELSNNFPDLVGDKLITLSIGLKTWDADAVGQIQESTIKYSNAQSDMFIAKLRKLNESDLTTLITFLADKENWSKTSAYQKLIDNLKSKNEIDLAGKFETARKARMQGDDYSNEAASINKNWKGVWEDTYQNRFESTTIEISDVTDKGFIFNLSAFGGADSGGLSNSSNSEDYYSRGTLALKGNTATFIDAKENADGQVPCIATFTLSPDGQTLHLKTDCDQDRGYTGAGVGFFDEFRKDLPSLPAVSRKDFAVYDGPSDEYLFKDDVSYKVFTDLVGKYFKIFSDTIMQPGTEEDKDGLGARVGTFGVAHAYTELESIIMITPDNKIWTAVIDEGDGNIDPIVRYFTNVPEWKNKLPKTIDEWRSRFSEYKVIYESK